MLASPLPGSGMYSLQVMKYLLKPQGRTQTLKSSFLKIAIIKYSNYTCPPPHEITKGTYMIESSYTCPHTCTVIHTVIYNFLSQQLFQCTCNEISQWVKYMPRYVLYFCFSSYVDINISAYAGFPKAIIVLTTKPCNDAIYIRSL